MKPPIFSVIIHTEIKTKEMWAAVFTPTADEIAKEIVAEEARLRALEEKAYWEGWDKGCKEKVIERLRNHEEGFRFSPKTYPEITQDMWADLIERGEVKIVAPTKEVKYGLLYMWVDNNRKEAQRGTYQQNLPLLKQEISNGSYRIVN